MKIKVISNKKNSDNFDLSDSIFKVEISPRLLAQAVRVNLANRRQTIAHSKNRGEVSGSGRKPFRQKGTGNARAGSVRSPVWIGGGVVFGPRKTRNFKKLLPKKIRRQTILAALSDKLKNKKFIVVESFQLTKIKTATIQSLLEKLPIEEGKILVILAKTDVNFELSAANLPFLKVIQIKNINLLDILKFDYILTDILGVKALQEIYGGRKDE